MATARYTVTVQAFDKSRVIEVEAQSYSEAIRKARVECGVRIWVTDVAR